MHQSKISFRVFVDTKTGFCMLNGCKQTKTGLQCVPEQHTPKIKSYDISAMQQLRKELIGGNRINLNFSTVSIAKYV